ncbi:MAG TPA: aldehyde dehydrogenase family protein [Polyangiales bacterium]|nr:aldehyde dehydrogenase family protein [Polyangiales bacterium]
MAIVESVTVNNGRARRLRLESPATRQTIGEIAVQTADEVRARVTAARIAQPAWAALGFPARAAIVRRVLAIVLAQSERLIDVITSETGRSRMETVLMELFPACDSLAYYSKHAERLLRDETPALHLLKTKKLVISYRPLGVVGIITPWNGPFVLSLNPTVQALMAGNCVVLKPSEVTPFSGKLVGELFKEAGLPPDVLSVLEGDGSTGAALVEAGVDKVSFTGSVATGRKIGEACGRNLIPCTLELGGNNPMIVCRDADIPRAAKGCVFGAFLNAGQFCCATGRVYVVDSVAEAFTRQVVDYVKSLKQGQSGEYDLGPAIWPRQIETVERHVQDALAKGATLLTGGKRNRTLGDLYFEPTVLTDVTPDMLLMHEETFGPVLPIVRVRDEAEALRLANQSSFGLAATVWTDDADDALRISKLIETGSVCVNDSSITYGVHEAPFGGRKQSGLGQVHGPTGLKGYCFAQSIVLERWRFGQEDAWYPYTRDKADAMQKVMHWLWGSRIGRLFT